MPTKRQVFYSFHYDNDVFRVQQIRNIGAIEGNSPAAPNQWEQIKSGSDTAIKKWIDDNMAYRSCVVVLVGTDTANRKWVKYEIEKAWSEGKGVVGIHIHNLSCPRNGTCISGKNSFTQFTYKGKDLSDIVKCYNPSPSNAYNDISNNMEKWK